MDEEHALFTMRERHAAQPVEERGAVGSVEDLLDRVVPVDRPDAGGDREQVQVVIAQNHGRAFPASASDFTRRSVASDCGPRFTRSPTKMKRSG